MTTSTSLRDIAHIARPASVVLLAETVRAARESHGAPIDVLKDQVCDGDYAVSSKHLAERLLASLRRV
jgi:anti-sigma28 factor (negative regulator of flagellin synthesis)